MSAHALREGRAELPKPPGLGGVSVPNDVDVGHVRPTSCGCNLVAGALAGASVVVLCRRRCRKGKLAGKLLIEPARVGGSHRVLP